MYNVYLHLIFIIYNQSDDIFIKKYIYFSHLQIVIVNKKLVTKFKKKICLIDSIGTLLMHIG